MIDIEPMWRRLDICEADLARLKALGGDKAPGWEEATQAVAALRAMIKELQRADRAKPPEGPSWRRTPQERAHDDAQWIEDRRGDKG